MQHLELDLKSFDLFKTIEDASVKKVHLEIPRFKIELTTQLNEILKTLGMTEMFNSAAANFGRISDQKLFVSTAIQKTFIEVDESGTNEAVTTDVGINRRSYAWYFNADHPFLFALRDLQTGLLLLQGRVENPTLYPCIA